MVLALFLYFFHVFVADVEDKIVGIALTITAFRLGKEKQSI
jgi:hypothetical protein